MQFDWRKTGYYGKVQTGSSKRKNRSGGSTNDKSATTYSISDLFNLVKTYDKEYRYNSVNPALLNEDGTLTSFEIVSHKKRSLNLQTFYMQKGDYEAAVKEDIDFNNNAIASANEEAESNRKFIKEQEEKRQNYKKEIDEMLSIMSPEAINVKMGR